MLNRGTGILAYIQSNDPAGLPILRGLHPCNTGIYAIIVKAHAINDGVCLT